MQRRPTLCREAFAAEERGPLLRGQSAIISVCNVLLSKQRYVLYKPVDSIADTELFALPYRQAALIDKLSLQAACFTLGALVTASADLRVHVVFVEAALQ